MSYTKLIRLTPRARVLHPSITLYRFRLLTNTNLSASEHQNERHPRLGGGKSGLSGEFGDFPRLCCFNSLIGWVSSGANGRSGEKYPDRKQGHVAWRVLVVHSWNGYYKQHCDCELKGAIPERMFGLEQQMVGVTSELLFP